MATISLTAPYNQVVKRNGLTVLVENIATRIPEGFESFDAGSAGFTLGVFENLKFEGDTIIEDVSRAFPTMTLSDFEFKSRSSFTQSGLKFNLGPSAMLMGVTMVNGQQTVSTNALAPSPFSVISTSNFPSSGHLFTSQRVLIEYVSKTQDPPTFTGYVVSGSNVLNNNDELVQFSGPE